MALDYRTPEQIADDYLDYLKAVKPDVDIKKQDSDWWIKSRPIGGIGAGIYSDQRLVNSDTFPQSARHDALGHHLFTWLDDTFKAPTSASGYARVTGDAGSTASQGLEFLYEESNNSYNAIEDVPFGAATSVLVPVIASDTGADFNLLSGAVLTIPSPPPGINSTAVVEGNISNGRDLERDEAAANRVLARIQSPPAGGNQNDYKAWALAADSAVTDASVLRFPFGFGTVGVVILAGTTDIDGAIDAGLPIVRTPSQDLIDTVKAFIDAVDPATDCLSVFGAQEVSQDVTVRVRYKQGTGSTILSGQTLTQEDLVKREVSRALYKIPPGGRQVGSPASGFVLASEIEEVIDLGLSASPYIPGTLEILSDRQVDDLAATGVNRLLGSFQVVAPGTITVVELT